MREDLEDIGAIAGDKTADACWSNALTALR